jgi:5'-nucleotidase
MRVLVSNDDGVTAPGIAAMAQALCEVADVTVVAPETGQSAAAHGITLTAPLSVNRVHLDPRFKAYSVDGRPADCVKLAIRELVSPRPDLVVSGINDGANAGINVLYSGTVAAAAEGAFLGIPSVAVSLFHTERMDFAGAAQVALSLIETYCASKPGRGSLININIPSLEQGRPRGVRVVPLSMQNWEDRFERVDGPGDRLAYWLRGESPGADAMPDTDLHAVLEGYVTITPLQFDLTNRSELKTLAGEAWRLPDR